MIELLVWNEPKLYKNNFRYKIFVSPETDFGGNSFDTLQYLQSQTSLLGVPPQNAYKCFLPFISSSIITGKFGRRRKQGTKLLHMDS